jgi:RNA polymerase sigma-70 factor (ECF subfamily)
LVEELPERQRTAVLLHKFRDLSYQEIAGLLDCSIPALKSILFRAYGTLRLRLSAEMKSEKIAAGEIEA